MNNDSFGEHLFTERSRAGWSLISTTLQKTNPKSKPNSLKPTKPH